MDGTVFGTLGVNLGAGSGVGGLLFLVGWIWLTVMGFRQGRDWWWGLVVLLIPGLGGLVFGVVKWPGTKVPLILLVAGLLLGGPALRTTLF